MLNRQTRFKGPTRTGSLTRVKFPNIADHRSRADMKAADRIQLVVQNDEAAWQSGVAVCPWPVITGQSGDRIRYRIVTKHAAR